MLSEPPQVSGRFGITLAAVGFFFFQRGTVAVVGFGASDVTKKSPEFTMCAQRRQGIWAALPPATGDCAAWVPVGRPDFVDPSPAAAIGFVAREAPPLGSFPGAARSDPTFRAQRWGVVLGAPPSWFLAAQLILWSKESRKKPFSGPSFAPEGLLKVG